MQTTDQTVYEAYKASVNDIVHADDGRGGLTPEGKEKLIALIADVLYNLNRIANAADRFNRNGF